MPNAIAVKIILLLLVCLFLESTASAESETLLVDRNGDESVSILAFGDSLTYGVGDGSAPGKVVEEPSRANSPAGYPKRIQNLSGVRVSNSGVPGEQLALDPGEHIDRRARKPERAGEQGLLS